MNYREKDVLAKWKTEFQKLYNSEAEPGTFDDAFYTYSVHEKDRLEKEYSALDSDFNADITVDEVMKVIGKAKSRKAVGLDNIPNEVLKNDVSIQFLHKLFHKIFNTSIILHKYKQIKGLGYYTYSKLYQSCVCPVLDYASEIWGYKGYDKIDRIQNRPIRAYLYIVLHQN